MTPEQFARSTWPQNLGHARTEISRDGSLTLYVEEGIYNLVDGQSGRSSRVTRADTLIGTDYHDDGSWVSEVRRAEHGYHLYWFHPYRADIAVWELDSAAHFIRWWRLDEELAKQFICSTLQPSIEGLVRAFLLIPDRRDEFAHTIEKRFSGWERRALKEVIWLIAKWPSHFSAQATKDAERFGYDLLGEVIFDFTTVEVSRGKYFREKSLMEAYFLLSDNAIFDHSNDKLDIFLGLQRMREVFDGRWLADLEIVKAPHWFANPGEGPSYGLSLECRFRLPSPKSLKIIVDDRADLRRPGFGGAIYPIHQLLWEYADYEYLMPQILSNDLGERELSFIFQAEDEPYNFPGSVSYTAGAEWSDFFLVPDTHFMRSKGNISLKRDIDKRAKPWPERKNQAIWRGSTTGGGLLDRNNVLDVPRVKLCMAAQQNPELLDAGISGLVQFRSQKEEEFSKILLTGRNLMGAFVKEIDMVDYKYLIDIDGNVNAWGLHAKLLMGSCILKVGTIWREWYYDRLIPWVHYVPVKSDLSDLVEQLIWCRENAKEAEAIGAAGRELAMSMEYDTEMKKAAKDLIEFLLSRSN